MCLVATLFFAFCDKLVKDSYGSKLVDEDELSVVACSPSDGIVHLLLRASLLEQLTHGIAMACKCSYTQHTSTTTTITSTRNLRCKNSEVLAVMRSTRSTTAFLALLVASSTNAFVPPSHPAATLAARSANLPATAATIMHATTVPRRVGLEAIPDADLKEADKTPPPSTFFECTLQAYNSAAAAIKDGYKLLEVEFPPLPAAEMASQVC